MGLFSWLFGTAPDNRDRREEDAERKLSPAMPMAAAGAELDVQSNPSETERELQLAAENDKRSAARSAYER